jgi:transcription termination factor Rho
VSDTSTDVVDARTAAAQSTDTSETSTTGTTGTATSDGGNGKARRKSGGLSTMVLAELQQVASTLGIPGTTRLRKGELIAAITAAQTGGAAPGSSRAKAEPQPEVKSRAGAQAADHVASPTTESRTSESRSTEPAGTDPAGTEPRAANNGGSGQDQPQGQPQGGDRPSRNRDQRPPRERSQQGDRQNQQGGNQQGDRQNQQGGNQQGQNQGGQSNRSDGNQQGGQPNQPGQNRPYYDDEDGTGRRRRRGRGRDRRPGVRGERGERFGGEAEPVIGEDDVLVPVGGIVDVLDNYAFVRTTGYLPGPNDVYITLAQVRKYGLRKGDAVTGAVKQTKDGERRDKFNALVRLDSVNGLDPSAALGRPDFNKLTPLYPQDRLRLESDPTNLTARVIDIVAPIGKGQRGLIVSPPKAGKTMVLQAIANAISLNNPEVHLMVVLVDERPEEVTDMQRSVKGEVIASTFDRPAEDHTVIAELAIERAKRLVELGHDVVVLLDSMTRLGRAYNLAAPASGRILSGGVDSSALYPPKRFFGAARNIEDGGSLTVLATALVETGSKMDDVIFEEFKGTGNMELKLDRRLADKRIFPAVDVDPSGTRKEEILLSPEELKIVWKLRRVLHALDSQQAIELLINKLKQTKSNYEFLLEVAKTTPMSGGSDD